LKVKKMKHGAHRIANNTDKYDPVEFIVYNALKLNIFVIIYLSYCCENVSLNVGEDRRYCHISFYFWSIFLK